MPPNNSCMYCGEIDASGTTVYKKPSVAKAWGQWLIKTIVLVGLLSLAGYLVFTDAGKLLALRVANSLGFKDARADFSEAVMLIEDQVPGVRRILEGSPTSVEFVEEELESGDIQVTVLHRDGSDLYQATFLVDLYSQEVYPKSDLATKWMYDEE